MHYPSALRFVLFCWFTLASWVYGQADALYRVRITAENPQTLSDYLEKQGFDVMHGVGPDWVDLVVTLDEWADVERMGYATLVMERGRPFNQIQLERSGSGLTPYPDLAEVEAALNDFATNFPEITKLVDITTEYGMPATSEGRHLYALKISDQVNDDEDEPNLLVVSAHHSREIVTPVIALHFIDNLTSGYGNNLEITSAVNNYEIWVAPVWNPDGYNEVFVGDNLWRKNRTVFPTGIGVDTNRNYPFGWDTACSGSTTVNTQTYKGPGPASEAETQTMMAFSEARRFAKILDFHSFGSEALYNYACLDLPDEAFWQQEATAISTAGGYGGAIRRPSADGEHYQWQVARMGNYGVLIETHTAFQPTYASALQEAIQLWPTFLYLATQPLGIWGRVTDANTGLPMQVALESPDAGFMHGETIESGGMFGRYYHFVPPGTYNLTFSKDGYQPFTTAVTLETGSSFELNVAMQSLCPVDFDSSGEVSIKDLLAIINAFGQTSGPQDLNGDNLVDLADLNLALDFWGDCP